MLLNFYLDANLQIGKEIINEALSDQTSNYLSNFRNVAFDPPVPNDRSALTRYNRRVLAYRALLFKAGLQVPSNLRPDTATYSTTNLVAAMKLDAQNARGKSPADYGVSATIFAKRRRHGLNLPSLSALCVIISPIVHSSCGAFDAA